MQVQLHNCDCMTFMETVPDKFYDIAIVDPPYYQNAKNIIVPNGDVSTTGIRRRKYDMPNWNVPNATYFRELVRVSKEQIIWGINYFPISLGSGRIVWDKCNDNGTLFSNCEIAYCSMIRRVRIFRFLWNGMLQGKSMAEYNTPQNVKRLKESRIHPTQKPVMLYKWLFREYVKEGNKVLDTHGGSMSSAIAAHDFGDGVFDLCEIDQAYFAAGKDRFEKHVNQGKLF